MSYASKGVRILLVGDDGVGKTSLILSLVTEEFPEDVPPRAEEITIPADVTPEKVPTHIVDFSYADQTEDELREELEQADVICVVYACDNDESIQRITSYWLPIVFDVCGEVVKPVVLVGNKSDCMEEEGGRMNELLAIMDEYPEVETCIECSAYDLKNISELFYYAQKAVLHPTAPLYSHDDQMLTEKCQEGLTRIFKICDLDNDGVLNDTELNEFQKRCFRNSLPPQGLEEVKSTVKKNMKEGVNEDGVTLAGFLYLHTLFIQKGRQETTWTALRRFGYGSDLDLRLDYLEPSFEKDENSSTELSSSGLDFVMELFYKYDQDEDDALSPQELENMSICSKESFGDLTSTCRSKDGWMTAEGFVALWILKTYLNHKWTMRMLATFGYIHGDMENQLTGLRVTRTKSGEIQKRKTQRTVFLVYVVGKQGCGKTALLQSFVYNYVGVYSKDEQHSQYTINSVQIKKQEVYIILKEVPEQHARQAVQEENHDAICYLYDVTNPESFAFVTELHKSGNHEKIPAIFVGTKSDISSVKQECETPPNEYAVQNSLCPLQMYSSADTQEKYRNVFKKIASVAMHMGTNDSSERSLTKIILSAGVVASLLAGIGFITYRYIKKDTTKLIPDSDSGGESEVPNIQSVTKHIDAFPRRRSSEELLLPTGEEFTRSYERESSNSSSHVYTHTETGSNFQINSFVQESSIVRRTSATKSFRSSKTRQDTDFRNSNSSIEGGKTHKRSRSEGGASKAFNITTSIELEEDGTVFCEPISEQLLCMLCNKVYKEPVITNCGHTFCRQCVLSSPNEICPTDGSHLSVVVANIAVREQVGELYVHCKYGCSPSPSGVPGEFEINPNGCPVTMKLNRKRDHELNCQYAPVQCPNSSLCPQLIKNELKQHLSQCQHTRCPHARFSCDFEGTLEELTAHLDSCRYEAMKGFLLHSETQMGELRKIILQKDAEAEKLRNQVEKLTEKVERLEMSTEKRIDLLDENLTKLSSDFNETRRIIVYIEKEMSNMDSRSYNVGAFDVQSVLKCKGTFVGHQGPVLSLCVFSSLLFSGSSDHSIKVWDTRSNYTCINTFTEHTGMVLTLCAYRGKLYSGSADCTISVFDIEKMTLIKNFQADENPICTLAVGNGMLFSGSLKSIKVWSLDTLKLITSLGPMNHWVRALCTTEHFLYCGSYQTIKIWDLKTLEQVRVIQTQGGSVYSLVVSSDYIIVGTYENCIHIWDKKTYKSVARLTGHVGTVYSLVLMTLVDSTRVISSSYDGSLRVWSLDNMQCSQILIRHQGSVTTLAVSRGRLFSGSVDSTVKVWQ